MFTPAVLPDKPWRTPDSPDLCTVATSTVAVEERSSSFLFSKPNAVKTTSSSSFPAARVTLMLSDEPTVTC